MNDALLDQLCQLYGIEIEFVDVWGKQRLVSADTKRRLLAVMGVPVDDPIALEQEYMRCSQHEWRDVIAPVQVVQETTQPIRIFVTLPRGQGTASWQFAHETGEQLSGMLAAEALEFIDRREIDGTVYERFIFSLPAKPGIGYHDFEVTLRAPHEDRHRLHLIVAPETCYEPPALASGARVFGPAVQLYAIRSKRNWGIGDFTDLHELVDLSASIGADVIGINPLHALFAHDPAHASPYSPSSRLLLNSLYLDVEAIEDYAYCASARRLVRSTAFQKKLKAARASELVDYQSVADAKEQVLRLLYAYFREHHLAAASARGRAFRAFQESMSGPLYRYALFEALQEYFHERDPKVWGWPHWPVPYRDPHAPEVHAFAEAHRERIEYFQYLQWQADLQLERVAERADELGLVVGLYLDLALAVDRGGAEAWANQHLYAVGASVGAPPDQLNLKGQDWALPPLIPDALRARAYEPFVATLRATMRHAGALRIDHVMSLMRLYWIPLGAAATDGAYVRYVFEELLGIVKLESQRNRCLVIGEDLGTIPPALQSALQRADMLSYRPLYFEKDADGRFKPPSDYPAQALVAVSTHDLATLHGFWQGDDVAERTRLGLYPSEEGRAAHLREREQDRGQLLSALARESLLPPDTSEDPLRETEMPTPLVNAVHRYLARSPAKLLMVQLEDIFGQRAQVNLPGTSSERPNWRMRLGALMDDWREDARLQSLAAAVRAERGRAPAAEARAAAPRVLPRATYRLQFNSAFRFVDAAALAPYLAALGISHCYASPYLKARSGSTHGYDIVDHGSLNPEIGSAQDYDQFVAALREHGIGQVLDIVPNHMGVGGDDNQWWLDVLENGPASAYAPFFDIDWQPLKHELHGKVLLPVLGDYYGNVLESGKLQLAFDASQGKLGARYFGHYFPLDPASYPQVLARDLARLGERLGAQDPVLLRFQSLMTAFRNLPGRNETSSERVAERRRDKEIHKAQLAELCRESAALRTFIEENLRLYAIVPGAVSAIDAMHQLLELQAYRLAYWRVAADEINYRRFFDINDLAGLRMEVPEVFAATHRFVLDLIRAGKVDGLRIDHPDGLNDPLQYFHHLHDAIAAGGPDQTRRVYLVAEKILAAHERLPADWPVDGTTGYDFMNLVNGLFVYGPAERAMTRAYHRFIGSEIDFDELLYERKKLIMKVALASEMVVLANRLDRLSEPDWHTRDFTLTTLRDALIEIVACFPVYRAYVTMGGASAEDRRYVEWAVAQAKKRNPATDAGVFDFVRDVLLLKGFTGRRERYRRAAAEFAQSFQQYTAPLMAKGLEDTSFYVYHRLVSLNEVGGDPRRFGTSVSAFHRANETRAREWPHSMLASSTHDSKRSEDVRARINVLSELVDEWNERVRRWAQLNRRHRTELPDIGPVPTRNDEYLIYQTLLGAWPLGELDAKAMSDFGARIKAYMQKAVREAKLYTSWINPRVEYEAAITQFIDGVLANPAENPFLADFLPFVRRVAPFGLYNSLSQTVLKLTAPGMPDLYQGSEVWDFSLVDPDNRRPVDYAQRARLLAALQSRRDASAGRGALSRELFAALESGEAKLYATAELLALRRDLPELFADGGYMALAVQGARADHVCAFARVGEKHGILVIVTRWFARLTAASGQTPVGPRVWGDTAIAAPPQVPAGEYTDVLTGRSVQLDTRTERAALQVGEILVDWPVAVLRQKIVR